MIMKLSLLAQDLEAFARRTGTAVETGDLGDLGDIQSLLANVSRVAERMAREVANLNNFADEITRDALAGDKKRQTSRDAVIASNGHGRPATTSAARNN